MRYLVTLVSPGIQSKTYEVAAESEQAAVAKANGRFVTDNPSVRYFEISAVVRPQRR